MRNRDSERNNTLNFSSPLRNSEQRVFTDEEDSQFEGYVNQCKQRQSPSKFKEDQTKVSLISTHISNQMDFNSKSIHDDRQKQKYGIPTIEEEDKINDHQVVNKFLVAVRCSTSAHQRRGKRDNILKTKEKEGKQSKAGGYKEGENANQFQMLGEHKQNNNTRLATKFDIKESFFEDISKYHPNKLNSFKQQECINQGRQEFKESPKKLYEKLRQELLPTEEMKFQQFLTNPNQLIYYSNIKNCFKIRKYSLQNYEDENQQTSPSQPNQEAFQHFSIFPTKSNSATQSPKGEQKIKRQNLKQKNEQKRQSRKESKESIIKHNNRPSTQLLTLSLLPSPSRTNKNIHSPKSISPSPKRRSQSQLQDDPDKNFNQSPQKIFQHSQYSSPSSPASKRATKTNIDTFFLKRQNIIDQNMIKKAQDFHENKMKTQVQNILKTSPITKQKDSSFEAALFKNNLISPSVAKRPLLQKLQRFQKKEELKDETGIPNKMSKLFSTVVESKEQALPYFNRPCILNNKTPVLYLNDYGEINKIPKKSFPMRRSTFHASFKNGNSLKQNSNKTQNGYKIMKSWNNSPEQIKDSNSPRKEEETREIWVYMIKNIDKLKEILEVVHSKNNEKIIENEVFDIVSIQISIFKNFLIYEKQSAYPKSSQKEVFQSFPQLLNWLNLTYSQTYCYIYDDNLNQVTNLFEINDSVKSIIVTSQSIPLANPLTIQVKQTCSPFSTNNFTSNNYDSYQRSQFHSFTSTANQTEWTEKKKPSYKQWMLQKANPIDQMVQLNHKYSQI